ncbi:MAG: class I fructose-bisphosphate aldolase family protein, partial [Candidatus Bathyarchaeia archaeon]
SGSTSLGPDPNRKVQVCSVEEAIMIGADAVSVHVNVGSDYENEMLMKLGKISDECDRFGMPLLAMMYPRGAKIQSEHALDFVAHAARLGAELGADVIKTNYTGSIESFKEVVSKCPVPVVIAGGPKTKSEEEFLQMVYDAIQAGAVGVSIGRNVFQSENPTLMVKALSAIVHKRSSASEAMKILGSEK